MKDRTQVILNRAEAYAKGELTLEDFVQLEELDMEFAQSQEQGTPIEHTPIITAAPIEEQTAYVVKTNVITKSLEEYREDLKKMGLKERSDFYNSNPKLYEEVMELQ